MRNGHLRPVDRGERQVRPGPRDRQEDQCRLGHGQAAGAAACCDVAEVLLPDVVVAGVDLAAVVPVGTFACFHVLAEQISPNGVVGGIDDAVGIVVTGILEYVERYAVYGGVFISARRNDEQVARLRVNDVEKMHVDEPIGGAAGNRDRSGTRLRDHCVEIDVGWIHLKEVDLVRHFRSSGKSVGHHADAKMSGAYSPTTKAYRPAGP